MSAAPTKLPVWRTVGQAYAIWAGNLPELFRIAWLWLLIMVPIAAFLMWWQVPQILDMMQTVRAGRPDPNPSFTVVTQALNTLIMLPIVSSIAVAWHRLLLRDEHVYGPYLRFDGLVVGYALLFFLIGLLPAVPQYLGQIYLAMTQPRGASEINLVGAALSFLGSIASIVAWFCSCRLFVVLPARALGRNDIAFGDAWAGTRHNTWRLFWGHILCILPMIMLSSVLAFWLLFSAPSRGATTIVWTILTLFWALFGMVGVGFLSLAYRHFLERSA
jgi:hypothetical protein